MAGRWKRLCKSAFLQQEIDRGRQRETPLEQGPNDERKWLAGWLPKNKREGFLTLVSLYFVYLIAACHFAVPRLVSWPVGFPLGPCRTRARGHDAHKSCVCRSTRHDHSSKERTGPADARWWSRSRCHDIDGHLRNSSVAAAALELEECIVRTHEPYAPLLARRRARGWYLRSSTEYLVSWYFVLCTMKGSPQPELMASPRATPQGSVIHKAGDLSTRIQVARLAVTQDDDLMSPSLLSHCEDPGRGCGPVRVLKRQYAVQSYGDSSLAWFVLNDSSLYRLLLYS
jgi:hypothetical protein